MRKVILYLEDEPSLRRHTTDLLKEQGCDVKEFGRIDQAREYFTDHSDDIACVVADLMMDDQWLNEYRDESQGGMLSGWVWLQRFVYPQKPNIPTVVYSGFVPYLVDFLKGKDQLSLLETYNIVFVEKGYGEYEGFSGLMNALKKMGI